MTRVAALFVQEDTVYRGIPDVECYDRARDALSYAGPYPVVAHPPCAAWGRFRWRVSSRKIEEESRYGFFAVEMVRRYGGVLEQPAQSALWEAARLPVRGVDAHGGYTLQVSQCWWGHRAEKNTWLYVVNNGVIPHYPFDFSIPESTLMNLALREREATPVDFARWLVELALQR